MKRLAILIAAPGSDVYDATGTQQDVEHWKKHLLSKEGGAWETNEIYPPLVNPRDIEVVAAIASTAAADYSVVTFSGHGRVEQNEDGYYVQQLFINDRNIKWPAWRLIPKSKKGLLVLDACRKVWNPPLLEKRASLLSANESNETASRELYRQLFDSALDRCEMGTITLYGCNFDESAHGSNGREGYAGGLYTYSLTRAGKKWHLAPNTSGILNVNEAHQAASAIVTIRQPQQHPQITLGRRLGIFPFSVKPTVVTSL